MKLTRADVGVLALSATLACMGAAAGCAAVRGAVPRNAGEVAARVHPLTVEACNACEEAKLLNVPLTAKGAKACEEACAVAHGLCSE